MTSLVTPQSPDQFKNIWRADSQNMYRANALKDSWKRLMLNEGFGDIAKQVSFEVVLRADWPIYTEAHFQLAKELVEAENTDLLVTYAPQGQSTTHDGLPWFISGSITGRKSHSVPKTAAPEVPVPAKAEFITAPASDIASPEWRTDTHNILIANELIRSSCELLMLQGFGDVTNIVRNQIIFGSKGQLGRAHARLALEQFAKAGYTVAIWAKSGFADLYFIHPSATTAPFANPFDWIKALVKG